MEEIIYKIDNWTIVKLLGGTAVILTSCFLFLSKGISAKIEKAITHSYDKKVLNIKGEIDKNNSILNSTIENYFSSSQKILDKRILAYELVWNSILEIRKKIPSGVLLIHQIMLDSELEDVNAFDKLDKNLKIGPLLRSYDSGVEVLKMVSDDEFLKYKPYLSDFTYKLFFTYRSLLGRVTHSFLYSYSKGEIYQWKKDKNLKQILNITLTNEELDYIFKIKVDSLTNIIDLIEYKILQDFRNSLNIKESTNDSIDYLKDIERILNIPK
ncbi:hypothetical protein [Flavobacterium sp. ZE23DGlu08]|uniref:hypothetical protein n=1 Tax=Flavobacterium sp. ZE23DGlu08 TaxID=3059026 RepID=UPI00265EF3DD|nr:hypothetical protein [Flavobacterium sp. ZE23DGlu08]WKL44779.1 hypothetical protein Q1W72_03970 [Flavobacterium sp. ZE23DGlu08]